MLSQGLYKGQKKAGLRDRVRVRAMMAGAEA